MMESPNKKQRTNKLKRSRGGNSVEPTEDQTTSITRSNQANTSNDVTHPVPANWSVVERDGSIREPIPASPFPSDKSVVRVRELPNGSTITIGPFGVRFTTDNDHVYIEDRSLPDDVTIRRLDTPTPNGGRMPYRSGERNRWDYDQFREFYDAVTPCYEEVDDGVGVHAPKAALKWEEFSKIAQEVEKADRSLCCKEDCWVSRSERILSRELSAPWHYHHNPWGSSLYSEPDQDSGAKSSDDDSEPAPEEIPSDEPGSESDRPFVRIHESLEQELFNVPFEESNFFTKVSYSYRYSPSLAEVNRKLRIALNTMGLEVDPELKDQICRTNDIAAWANETGYVAYGDLPTLQTLKGHLFLWRRWLKSTGLEFTPNDMYDLEYEEVKEWVMAVYHRDGVNVPVHALSAFKDAAKDKTVLAGKIFFRGLFRNKMFWLLMMFLLLGFVLPQTFGQSVGKSTPTPTLPPWSANDPAVQAAVDSIMGVRTTPKPIQEDIAELFPEPGPVPMIASVKIDRMRVRQSFDAAKHIVQEAMRSQPTPHVTVEASLACQGSGNWTFRGVLCDFQGNVTRGVGGRLSYHGSECFYEWVCPVFNTDGYVRGTSVYHKDSVRFAFIPEHLLRVFTPDQINDANCTLESIKCGGKTAADIDDLVYNCSDDDLRCLGDDYNPKAKKQVFDTAFRLSTTEIMADRAYPYLEWIADKWELSLLVVNNSWTRIREDAYRYLVLQKMFASMMVHIAFISLWTMSKSRWFLAFAGLGLDLITVNILPFPGLMPYSFLYIFTPLPQFVEFQGRASLALAISDCAFVAMPLQYGLEDPLIRFVFMVIVYVAWFGGLVAYKANLGVPEAGINFSAMWGWNLFWVPLFACFALGLYSMQRSLFVLIPYFIAVVLVMFYLWWTRDQTVRIRRSLLPPDDKGVQDTSKFIEHRSYRSITGFPAFDKVFFGIKTYQTEEDVKFSTGEKTDDIGPHEGSKKSQRAKRARWPTKKKVNSSTSAPEPESPLANSCVLPKLDPKGKQPVKATELRDQKQAFAKLAWLFFATDGFNGCPYAIMSKWVMNVPVERKWDNFLRAAFPNAAAQQHLRNYVMWVDSLESPGKDFPVIRKDMWSYTEALVEKGLKLKQDVLKEGGDYIAWEDYKRLKEYLDDYWDAKAEDFFPDENIEELEDLNEVDDVPFDRFEQNIEEMEEEVFIPQPTRGNPKGELWADIDDQQSDNDSESESGIRPRQQPQMKPAKMAQDKIRLQDLAPDMMAAKMLQDKNKQRDLTEEGSVVFHSPKGKSELGGTQPPMKVPMPVPSFFVKSKPFDEAGRECIMWEAERTLNNVIKDTGLPSELIQNFDILVSGTLATKEYNPERALNIWRMLDNMRLRYEGKSVPESPMPHSNFMFSREDAAYLLVQSSCGEDLDGGHLGTVSPMSGKFLTIAHAAFQPDDCSVVVQGKKYPLKFLGYRRFTDGHQRLIGDGLAKFAIPNELTTVVKGYTVVPFGNKDRSVCIPGYHKNDLSKTCWVAEGWAKTTGEHNVSTVPGVSGAPVVEFVSKVASRRCVGIHAHGGMENIFRPFTKEDVAWINETPRHKELKFAADLSKAETAKLRYVDEDAECGVDFEEDDPVREEINKFKEEIRAEVRRMQVRPMVDSEAESGTKFTSVVAQMPRKQKKKRVKKKKVTFQTAGAAPVSGNGQGGETPQVTPKLAVVSKPQAWVVKPPGTGRESLKEIEQLIQKLEPSAQTAIRAAVQQVKDRSQGAQAPSTSS